MKNTFVLRVFNISLICILILHSLPSCISNINNENSDSLSLLQSDFQQSTSRIEIKLNVEEKLIFSKIDFYLKMDYMDTFSIDLQKYGELTDITLHMAKRFVKFENHQVLKRLTFLNYIDSLLPNLNYLNIDHFECQCPNIKGSMNLNHFNTGIFSLSINNSNIDEFRILNPDQYGKLSTLNLSNNLNLKFLDTSAYGLINLKTLHINNTQLNLSDFDFTKFQNLNIIYIDKNIALSPIQLNQISQKNIQIKFQ